LRNRVSQEATERLEPDAGKLARPVLRGLSGGNTARLPDFLPNIWGKGERVGKDFYFADGEERRCVYEMYACAGLITHSTPGITIPRSELRPAAPAGSTMPAASGQPVARTDPTAPVTERTAAARAVLDTAERSAGMRSREPTTTHHSDAGTTSSTAELASDPQLGLIVRLINDLRTDKTADVDAAHAISQIGARFGITGLAELRKKDQLRRKATSLTRLNASKLIDALKALDGNPVARAA
jgi:hypothetical protein